MSTLRDRQSSYPTTTPPLPPHPQTFSIESDDSDDPLFPAWKWEGGTLSHDPWYGPKPSARKKRVGGRWGLAALSSVDMVIWASLLLLLVLVKEQDHRACDLRHADMAWYRRSLIRCQEKVREHKRNGRGQLWSAWSECNATATNVRKYFDYIPGQTCPDSAALSEKLRFQDRCHNLPRRRCYADIPPTFLEPHSHASTARWRDPDPQNIQWELHRSTTTRIFNLSQEQSVPWERLGRRGVHRLSITSVLNLKPPGHIRIGLDVGGGRGTFAAKMAERGALIVTAAGDLGSPNLEVLSSRGLPGLHLPLQVRLPFFDGTLDIIHHAGGVQRGYDLDSYVVEHVLFDWDRVLRPGGILWLEGVVLSTEQLRIVGEFVHGLGYKTHVKRSRGVRKGGESKVEVTFVLEKPLSRPKRTEPLAIMTR